MDRIPYGRQSIDKSDVSAVIEALQSEWLTTGPTVEKFEKALCQATGAQFAVAVSSGTAALHAMVSCLDIGPGDEVIIPAITFAATANCVLYQGATPVFADVVPTNLTIDPESVRRNITSRTRAIIAMDYGGHPCDYERLTNLCRHTRIALVSDACHSLGASFRGRKVGSLADMTAFSFHPVKHITTAEGGAIVTMNETWAKRLKRFRNHGLESDTRSREAQGTWTYDMLDLGYNYRLSDIQCALGISQLKHLDAWVQKRRTIAKTYRESLKKPIVCLTESEPGHSYHLFVVRTVGSPGGRRRDALIRALREEGIMANVHYRPIYQLTYYRKKLGDLTGLYPHAEKASEEVISLPMFPQLSEASVGRVINAVNRLSSLSGTEEVPNSNEKLVSQINV